MGTDPFFLDRRYRIDIDIIDTVFILLYNPFPNPDHQFVTRSFPDHDIIYIFN